MLGQYVISLAVTSLTHFLLAIFVYANGKRRLTNITYALYSAAIAWWSALEAYSITVDNASSALLWWRINHIGVIFIPIFFVHFVVSLLEPHERRRKAAIVRTGYFWGLLSLALDSTPAFIKEVVPKFDFRFFINPGVVYPVFFMMWVAWALYGLVELFRIYRRSTGIKRNQLTYFCWSMLVAYIGGIPNFLPTFNVVIPVLMPYGTYAVALYAFMTTYAIVRHRLLDINIAITRTSVFMVVYAILLGLPLLGALSWQPQLERLFGRQWWVGLWFVCAALATAAHYLNLFFQRRAEDRLLREQRRYQQTLLTASVGMTQIRDLHRLLNVIVRVLVKQVRLTHAGIFLVEKDTDRYILRAARGGQEKLQVGMALEKYDPLVRFLKQRRAILVQEELKAMLSEESERFTEGGFYQDMRLALNRMEQMRASLAIPSFADQRLLGFLVLGQKTSGQIYSTDDLSVFSTLANQAALAIENAQFFDELKVAQAQLFQAEKLTIVGQMASGMAHEIRNPLTIISTECQLYLDRLKHRSPQSEAEQQMVAEIQKVHESVIEECTRASTIIEQILKHSRPTRGAKAPVELTAAMEEALALARYTHTTGTVTVVKQYAADKLLVEGFATQIAEVLVNLILNAHQAMERAGGGTLTLMTRRQGPNAEAVVTDTGPGIAPENLKRLFEPFFTTRHEGTGLGLFICHRIIRDHKGQIEVQSEVGQGTTFTVKLPVSTGAATETTTA
ncbi:MAG: GAF domain-containing protein [Candidatus Omnitrophica bacterium]|nr:GAF domain-containing protein [Candidatus Omnitrophota bacterium]